MMVGNEKQTLFWHDTWIGDLCLKEKFPRLYVLSSQKNHVISWCGFWDGFEWVWSFQWRRNFFEWEKQLLFYLQVMLLQVVLHQDLEECVLWRHQNSGVFSIKSLTRQADCAEVNQQFQMESHSIFNNIWKGLAHPTAKLVVCFALIGRLKKEDRLHRLNIIQDGNLRCVLCNIHVEMVDHLFMECMFAWKTWCLCFRRTGLDWVVPNSLKSMFESWSCVGLSGEKKKIWFSFFMVVRSLRGYRNGIIFYAELV